MTSSQTRIENGLNHRLHDLVFLISLLTTFIYIFFERYVFDLPLALGIIQLITVSVYAIRNSISRNFFVFNFLEFLGSHSFSIYLFHMSYYFIILKSNDLLELDIAGTLLVIVGFPVFFFFCLFAEWFVSQISSQLLKFSDKLLE